MSSLISPSSPGSAGSSSAPSSPPTPPSPNIASRPVRSTRGRRLTDLHGEGDDEFWTQEFFTAAQDDDEDFDLRDEAADAEADDAVDSDFFDSEDEDADDDDEAEEKEPQRAKRKGQYVDPRAKKAKAAAPPRAKAKPAAPQAPASTAVAAAAAPASAGRVSSPSSFLQGIGGLRKSSRSSTVSASQSLVAKEEQRRRSSRSLARGKLHFPVKSQAQQLEEAVETERANRESLQLLLRIEEERKKVHLRKKRGKGPTVLLRSSKASTSVSWSATAPLPSVFNEQAKALPYGRCVVSNAPARYLHRWTGQPFRGAAEWRAMEEAWRRGEKFVNAEQGEREREEKEREKRRTSRRDRADRDEKAEAETVTAPAEEGREAAASAPAAAGQQKRIHKKRTRGAAEEVTGAKEEAAEDRAEKAAVDVEEVKETAAAEDSGAGWGADSRKTSPTSASARTAKRAKTSKAASKAKGK